MTCQARADRRPTAARATALALAAAVAACTQKPPAPPAPDPYAQTVRLDYRYKRLAQLPSLVIDFSVMNVSAAPVRDVRISCDQTTLSGAHLQGTSLVIAGPIAPQASATHADFDTGFLRPSESHVTCRVSGVAN